MSPAGSQELFSEPRFVERIQAGDPEALEAVVRAYLAQIFRAARGAGLNREQAEDAAQATFTTFVETAARFEGRSHVRTWLFGILYRKVAEARRQVRRDEATDDIDQVLEERIADSGGWVLPPRPADLKLEDSEIRAQIESCLDTATPMQRMAFILREVEGLGSEEICNVLDVSLTNLGVLLHRVRNRLRECLEKRGVIR